MKEQGNVLYCLYILLHELKHNKLIIYQAWSYSLLQLLVFLSLEELLVCVVLMGVDNVLKLGLAHTLKYLVTRLDVTVL